MSWIIMTRGLRTHVRPGACKLMLCYGAGQKRLNTSSIGRCNSLVNLFPNCRRSIHGNGYFAKGTLPDQMEATPARKFEEGVMVSNAAHGSEIQPGNIEYTQIENGSMANADKTSKPVHDVTEQTPDIRKLSKTIKLSGLEMTKEPYIYISSLPSKASLSRLVDALNTWYSIPPNPTNTIRQIVTTLMNVSLMLDDIQDKSPTRRGAPSTHIKFGVGQTINSATFMQMKAIQAATSLGGESLDVVLEELEQIHIGQGFDLCTTFNRSPPSIFEYYQSIEQKTGGFFRMTAKLMQTHATKNTNVNIDTLMTLLGRYYQIRDDYFDIQGLVTGDSKLDEYNDLDQGCFTLPIIHLLRWGGRRVGIRDLFKVREEVDEEGRIRVINGLKEMGSLAFVKKVLGGLVGELEGELGGLEREMGVENEALRGFVGGLES